MIVYNIKTLAIFWMIFYCRIITFWKLFPKQNRFSVFIPYIKSKLVLVCEKASGLSWIFSYLWDTDWSLQGEYKKKKKQTVWAMIDKTSSGGNSLLKYLVTVTKLLDISLPPFFMKSWKFAGLIAVSSVCATTQFYGHDSSCKVGIIYGAINSVRSLTKEFRWT